jgi:nitroreductase
MSSTESRQPRFPPGPTTPGPVIPTEEPPGQFPTPPNPFPNPDTLAKPPIIHPEQPDESRQPRFPPGPTIPGPVIPTEEPPGQFPTPPNPFPILGEAVRIPPQSTQTHQEILMAKSNPQMNVFDAINGRCSVRSYAPGKVEQATLRVLLNAAVKAPTAIHKEPWEFVIIQETATLKRLSDRAKILFLEEIHQAHLDRGGHALDTFTDPAFDVFYNAGTLVVICGCPMSPFVVADCWLAAENLMLAAHALGLGTCVIGSAASALNTPEVKDELGIPVDVIPIAPIAVGVPSGDTPPTRRKEPHVLLWK